MAPFSLLCRTTVARQFCKLNLTLHPEYISGDLFHEMRSSKALFFNMSNLLNVATLMLHSST
jgi:hypothetical protein